VGLEHALNAHTDPLAVSYRQTLVDA